MGYAGAHGTYYCGSVRLPELYVDSLTGDDTNSGLSVAPFRTLARATQNLHSGTTVYLARGSRFREELMGWPVGVKVRAYGAGPIPIVDGRDVASNAAFTKTTGRTNVYEIAWTHGFAVDGGKSRHRAWEAGVMMARAASLDTCDATPGSFYAGAATVGGPDLVYVHATGSTAPTLEYQLSRRRYCVNLYQAYNQADIEDVETVGNAYADGSLLIDGVARRCVARDGRTHNAFILGTAIDCQALGIEPGFATMFISYYDDTGQFGGPAERDIVYRGCVADALGGDASLISAYFVHTNNTGRIFGTVQFESCHANGCRDGWGGSAARVFLNYKCSYESITFAYSYQPVEDVVLLGGEGELSGVVNGKLFATQAPIRVIAHGLKCRAPGGGAGPISINHPGAVVSIDRCTVLAPAGGAISYTRGTVTLRRSIFAGNNLISAYLGGAAQLDVYDADLCCYWADNVGNGAFGKAFGGVQFFVTLVSWRTHLESIALGAGRDANSIAQDPLVSPDFTIGNPAVLAMGAGAEPDEEDDPELQALWMQYRVAGSVI